LSEPKREHATPSPHFTPTQKRERLHEVLARHNGNKIAAARELGVTRKTIYNWMNK
jgi:transcriptional regulator with PAS, ATPase and Fis domain